MTGLMPDNCQATVPYKYDPADLKSVNVDLVYVEGMNVISIYVSPDDPEGTQDSIFKEIFREGMNFDNEVDCFLYVGGEGWNIPLKELWETYEQFCEWRKKRFGDIFLPESAYGSSGLKGSYIHEEYVLFWEDENGAKYAGIDKALEQAGVCKSVFDWICTAAWAGLIEERFGVCSGLELCWRGSDFGLKVMFGQGNGTGMDDYWELCHAGYQNHKNIKKLKENMDDLEDGMRAILNEREDKNINRESMEKLEEKLVVVYEEHQTCRKLLEKSKRDDKAIREVLSGQRYVL